MGFSEILNLIIGGGMTGLLGSVITSFTNYKMQKIKNEQDLKMKELDIKIMEKEADLQIKLANIQTEGQVEVAEIEALKKSYEIMNKDVFTSEYMEKLWSSMWTKWLGAFLTFLFGFVDFMKHAARPLITYYMILITSYVTWVCYSLLIKATGEGPLSVLAASELFDQAVKVILFLTISCVSWWFGDRRVAKFMMRLNDGNVKK